MSETRLTLYLAPWQKRMVKDFMPAGYFKGRSLRNITKIIFGKVVMNCPSSYKIPNQGIRRGDWVFYLTDEQMTIVKERFGVRIPITSLNIGPELLATGDIQFR